MGTISQSTSMADALFSRTQQRVLGLLYGRPDRTFFATEIIKHVAGGRGAVQRELGRLVDSGLAVVTSVGNQRHYRANGQSPIFRELRSLVLKTSGLADPLRAALAPLRRKIDLALIYGSVARGEDRASSDVDLLVVAADIPLERLYARLERAEKTLGRTIHPTLLTPEEFRSRRQNLNPFVTKLLSRPTIPLIGTLHGEPAAR